MGKDVASNVSSEDKSNRIKEEQENAIYESRDILESEGNTPDLQEDLQDDVPPQGNELDEYEQEDDRSKLGVRETKAETMIRKQRVLKEIALDEERKGNTNFSPTPELLDDIEAGKYHNFKSIDPAEEQQDNNSDLDQQDEDLDNEDIDNDVDDVVSNDDVDVELDLKPGFYKDFVVMKVDGQLQRISKEEALSRLQKNQAADKRLEQASQLEREAQQSRQTQQQDQPSLPDVDRLEAEIRQLRIQNVQAIEDGEAETSADLQAEIDTRLRQVSEITSMREQASSIESKLRASGRYDDIYNDQTMLSVASQFVRKLAAQGFGSPEENMIEGMELARDWRTGKTRSERLQDNGRKSQDDAKNRRLSRKKRAQKPLRGAATVQKKAPVKQERELSAQEKQREIFERQKRLRNQ